MNPEFKRLLANLESTCDEIVSSLGRSDNPSCFAEVKEYLEKQFDKEDNNFPYLQEILAWFEPEDESIDIP